MEWNGMEWCGVVLCCVVLCCVVWSGVVCRRMGEQWSVVVVVCCGRRCVLCVVFVVVCCVRVVELVISSLSSVFVDSHIVIGRVEGSLSLPCVGELGSGVAPSLTARAGRRHHQPLLADSAKL